MGKECFKQIKKTNDYIPPALIRRNFRIDKISEKDGVLYLPGGIKTKTYEVKEKKEWSTVADTVPEQRRQLFLKSYMRELCSIDRPFLISIKGEKVYITYQLKTGRKNDEQREDFGQLEEALEQKFINYPVQFVPLSGTARLEILHNYLYIGSDEVYTMNVGDYFCEEVAWKQEFQRLNFQQPDMFLANDTPYMAVYIQSYDKYSISLINEMRDICPDMLLGMWVYPFPGNVSDIMEHHYYDTGLLKKKFGEELSEENLLLGINMCITAKNEDGLSEVYKKLDKLCHDKYGMRLACYNKCQKDAFFSVMPIGMERATQMRIVQIKAAGALLMFPVKEI